MFNNNDNTLKTNNNDDIEDSRNLVQCNKCNLWAHLHYILMTEQEATEKMLKCDDEQWFCKNCV